MAQEPFVEGGLAAGERIETVMLGQRLGAPVAHALRGVERARLREELAQPGVVLGRAIEQLDEVLPAPRLEHEVRAVGEQTLCLDNRCIDDEVGQGPVCRLCRLTYEPVSVGLDAEVPALGDLAHATQRTQTFRTGTRQHAAS